MVNTYRPVLKRTMGIGPPADGLLWGEPAFANESEAIFIGKADGTEVEYRPYNTEVEKFAILPTYVNGFTPSVPRSIVVFPTLRMCQMALIVAHPSFPVSATPICTFPIELSALEDVHAVAVANRTGDPANSFSSLVYLTDNSILSYVHDNGIGNRLHFLFAQLSWHY